MTLNPLSQQIVDVANTNSGLIQGVLDTLNAQNASLTSQLAQLEANPPLTLIGLQGSPWELLWGVGRSHPVTNPPIHGTASFVVGEPAEIIFAPAVLPSGESDNLFALRRTAPYIPLARLQSASKLTYSLQLGVSDPTAVQALETDLQMQLGTKVWEAGFQFHPGSPKWTLNVYNKAQGAWQPTGLTLDPALISGGKTASIVQELAIDPSGLTYTAISLNGTRQSLGIHNPVVTDTHSFNYLNIAVQPDAMASAKPYNVTLGAVSLTLS